MSEQTRGRELFIVDNSPAQAKRSDWQNLLMNYLQAAEAVLRESDEPLTTREVTERALAKGLLHTSGKTPEASMSAALYREANSSSTGRIRRLAEPGKTRARRGTVRWVWRG